MPTYPMLMISSWNTIEPKQDQKNDLGHADVAVSSANGDLLTDTILYSTQTQCLYDVFFQLLLAKSFNSSLGPAIHD
ncbi:hypothetical protein CROQUDRAFT_100030 [Cronartium quercuum f. sp. fusiforme G11]|uniref:Uncharacterized protein n=1 Tax=Cronartium quercuum f. sp. fusiforme G11 TaxID=708437 RepID=A0A9P6NA29_9BASI|nr:hypothetical protein CROQUDRAFT_100030 [Cronartium quercuum f. sp. fusiforme G11]